MSKFKVGDKLKLKSGLSCINLNHIDMYTVGKVYENAVALIGFDYAYTESVFMLAEKSGEVVDDTSDVLTPLQAAEAILNGKDLLYLNYLKNWVEVGKSLHYSLDFLNKEKFRLKPKKILINGVEVPAPLDKKREEGLLYYPNISTKNVTMTNAGNRYIKLCWATKEDAQQVLDAMLIPFNNLNEGDK